MKDLAKKAFSAAVLSMFCLVTFAQTVNGIVKDTSGEPMIGVNVLVKGTTNGTITDLDGLFTIQNVPANSTLVVSYIGYLNKEVAAGKDLIIVLEEDNKTLDEVVVIGYGTVKRRDLTGAVASVTGESLAANPVANVAQALQGQLPGVSVVAQDGRPGATMSVRVRGGGSITQSNDPLFIVDGVQVDGIDDIPADNIESIDVLKDAASTAIYGARGANGVILVTTKGGKEGRAIVKYNMYYQVKQKPDMLDVMDAYDYVLWNWSYGTAYGESYGDAVAKYFGLGSSYGNHLNEYKNMKSHNYMDDVLQRAGSWNHDVSLSGGNDRTKYYAAINYTDDDGVRINSGYKRWNVNMKVNQKITKNLDFNADVRYTETKLQGDKFNYATSAYTFRPIDNPLGDATATAAFGNGSPNLEDEYNPVNLINNYDKIKAVQRIRAKGELNWQIIKGLTAKTELSLSRYWTDTKTWNAGNNPGDTSYSVAKLEEANGYNVRWATTLNYEVQGLKEDHSLSFLVGNELLSNKKNTATIQGAGYPDSFTMNDAFGMINMSDSSLGKDEVSYEIGTAAHTVSWFGRANYSYKGRYLFTATFRADGSSKFAPNHHWGYFPAGAFAWRISDEPFLKSAENWLDNLKLRLSYGTSGADNIDPSLWKETWTTEQVTIDGETVTTYVPGEMLSNEDLKWETTISRNLGIDFGFWNNRLRGSIDAYWNTTKNILMKVPVDASSGYSYQFQNVAKTSNKGVEVSIGADLVRTKDFTLGINATYNFNKNKIDKLSDSALADTHTGWGSSMRVPYYDYVIREGQSVGLVQGFKSAGFYTPDDFTYANGVYTLKTGVPDIANIVNYPTGVMNGFQRPDGQNATPGMMKFEDINGDGVVNDDDATIIGETMPKHTGGFTLNARWKQIDFSAGFTYQIGGDVYNANAMWSMMGNKDTSLGGNRLEFVKDTYKVYDVNASGDLYLVTDPDALNTLNKNAKYGMNYSEYGIASSQFIEDASYLRLQTLTIGYTFPKIWTKKVGIENFRIYFTGSNLFCLAGYSGLDPDVNTNTDAGGDGFPTPYYDYQSYPKTRTYTFGFNLTF